MHKMHKYNLKTKTMEKKKFQKLVERMAQDINSGKLDISWMFTDEENCMNMQERLNAESRINMQKTLYPWENGNTTENKWREYTLEESGLTHEQDNVI